MAAIRLKGHEKFHLREGWIAKGLYGVSANPRVFSGSDGTDQLGVGTNISSLPRNIIVSTKILPV